MSAYSAARAIANYAGGAVAVSGESDLVVDSSRAVLSEGGSAYMPKVTGFGCSLGGVCAVYAAVAEPFVAALTATNIYNAAGAFAHGRANGPASFKVEFIDALYNLSPQEVAQNTFRIL
jgi:hydroxyethylthiazole kinase